MSEPRQPLNPRGMRFVAGAMRDGHRPPGAPALLEDAANLIEAQEKEIERLRSEKLTHLGQLEHAAEKAAEDMRERAARVADKCGNPFIAGAIRDLEV